MKVLMLTVLAMGSFAATALSVEPYPRSDKDCAVYAGTVEYLDCLRTVNRDKG